MSLLSKETISVRKKDLSNQRSLSLGFKKLIFAHKATAGQTVINLSSLTQPSEMASNGFTNPNASDLLAANILFYRDNLNIRSSLRGDLIDYLSYSVSSSSQITLSFSAEENEIFVCTLDNDPATGSQVVDAAPIVATGTLSADLTDINVGVPFETNKFSSQQIGAVILCIDGQVQMRNVGNATASISAEGNYQEVPSTGGLGNVLRLNQSAPVDRSYVVLATQGYAERPTGSMMAVIEAVQGQVNNMAPYVADAVGQTVSTVLGAAPSNVDLQQFGSRVTAAETVINSLPTMQRFTSGSGTYLLPSGVKWIRVRMVGGGGGGGGSGSSGTGGLGGTGGTTTFGTSYLTATGGGGGYRSAAGGAGGTATITIGTAIIAMSGSRGQGSGYQASAAQMCGSNGAASPLGGAGNGGANISGGSAAEANSGSGGGGAGNSLGNADIGSGGGSGGYIEIAIMSPNSSYSYSIGTGGAGGSAGSSGYAGGAGGSGVIIVEEYYK